MNLQSIDSNQLKNYLISRESPVEEIDLFKDFYPRVPFVLTDYNFFKAHFLIHHSLYKLQGELIDQGYLLFIRLSKVYLKKFPEDGNCCWFSESQVSFCGNPSEEKFCSIHKRENQAIKDRNMIYSDPLKVYYSDLQNLEQLDEANFKLFSDSGIYLAENIIKIQKALDLFALHPSANFSRIAGRFRYLVKESHPDGGGDSEYSFQEIKEAYDILANWKNRGKSL